MALIQRGKNDFGDILVSGAIVFPNWEIEEDDTTNNLRITNNGDLAMSFEDGTRFVGIGTDIIFQKLQVDGNIYLGTNDSGDRNGIHCGGRIYLSADGQVRIISDLDSTSGAGASDILFGYGSNVDTDANEDFNYDDDFPRVEVMRVCSANDSVAIGLGGDEPLQTLHVNGNILTGLTSTSDVGIELIPQLGTVSNTDGGGRIFFRESDALDTLGFSLGYDGGNPGDNILNWDANTFNISRHSASNDGVVVLSIPLGTSEVNIEGDLNLSSTGPVVLQLDAATGGLTNTLPLLKFFRESQAVRMDMGILDDAESLFTGSIASAGFIHLVNSDGVETFQIAIDGVAKLTVDSTGVDVLGSQYKINGTTVLSATELHGDIVTSSLTSVGVLANLDLIGDVIIEGTGTNNDMKIGNMGTNDHAGFRHNDLSASTDFCITQSNVGLSTLNCVSGQSIEFSVANVSQMTLDSSGNLGIGTSSPNDLLNLGGGNLRLSSVGNGGAGIRLIPSTAGTAQQGGRIFISEEDATDNFGFSLGYNGIGSSILNWGLDSFNISRHDNSANGVVVLEIPRATSEINITGDLHVSGNLGLGLTDPDEQLEITGRIHLGQTSAPVSTTDKLYNVAGVLTWDGIDISTGGGGGIPSSIEDADATTTITTEATAETIIFRTNSTEKMRILSGGNVGIGTSSPNDLLNLSAGSLRLSSVTNGNAGIHIIPLLTTENSGGRMFFSQSDIFTDRFGFSTGYNGGATNDILNWTALTYNISRHNNDATGVVVLEMSRTTSEITIIGDLSITGDLNVGDGTAGIRFIPIGTTSDSGGRINFNESNLNVAFGFSTGYNGGIANTILNWAANTYTISRHNNNVTGVIVLEIPASLSEVNITGDLNVSVDVDITGGLTVSGINVSGGNLGVGTGSPNDLLNLAGGNLRLSSVANGGAGIRLIPTTTGTAQQGGRMFFNEQDANDQFGFSLGYEGTASVLNWDNNTFNISRHDSSVDGEVLLQMPRATSTINIFSSSSTATQEVLAVRRSRISDTQEYIQFYENGTISTGTAVGVLEDIAGTFTLTSLSDKRLKENINEYTGGYNNVKNIMSKTFDWKYSESKNVKGFVAQDFIKDCPEVLSKSFTRLDDETEYYGMSQSLLIPELWSCCRELIKRVEELENKINL